MKGILLTGNNAGARGALAADLCRELAGAGLKVAAARLGPAESSVPDAAREFADACSSVVCMDQGISTMLWPGQGFLPDLLPLARADVLVAEAGHDVQTGWLPRVLMDPAPEGEDSPWPAIGAWGSPGLDTLPALAGLLKEKGFVLPGLDCGSCGREDCAALGREIVAGGASTEDCLAANGGMKVTVNGAVLGVNLFVERMLSAGLTAMLSQLKGFVPGKIVIEVDG